MAKRADERFRRRANVAYTTAKEWDINVAQAREPLGAAFVYLCPANGDPLIGGQLTLKGEQLFEADCRTKPKHNVDSAANDVGALLAAYFRNPEKWRTALLEGAIEYLTATKTGELNVNMRRDEQKPVCLHFVVAYWTLEDGSTMLRPFCFKGGSELSSPALVKQHTTDLLDVMRKLHPEQFTSISNKPTFH